MKRVARFLAAVAVVAACRDDTTGPSHEPGPATPATAAVQLEGWFHVLWGDPPSTGGPALLRYQLLDDGRRATELVLDSAQTAKLGGPRGIDRRRVRVTGEPAARGRVRVRTIELDRAAAAPPSAALTGSQPFITIGCKFADVADEPHTIATYQQWTAGATYPGLTHHWREQSYGQMDVAGSTVVGWYTLPHPMASYGWPGGIDFGALMADCTAAADPAVNFPQYSGINLQFNAWNDYSWGGGWTLSLDGQTKSYGMTWMASWADMTVYAHEEGHTFGLPHSSGPYGAVYDSRWDVMSNLYPYYDGAEGTYIPQHTIAMHKGLLGWIPGPLSFTAQQDMSHTITLERLARPTVDNYRVAWIPLPNFEGNQVYSVEARRLVGRYDSHVPADAVVLHRVSGGVALVVDPDGNGDPNDEGAQWTAGETFTDPVNGVTMTVDSMTATGFRITITRKSTGLWTALAPLPAARSSFAAGAAGGLVYAVGGKSGTSTLKSVQAYDPGTNSWSAKAGLPAARYDPSGAATIAGVLYVAGGRNAAGAPTRTLYAYNASANSWTTRAPLPAASGCGASANIGGRLYVLTGCDATAGFKGRLHRYTPSTNSWTARASAPAAHGFPAVGAINGLLYVAGGRNAAGAATSVLHVYDPGTNSWTSKAPMPAVRFGAPGAVIGGKLYVVGGTDGQGAVATTFVYDPATNQWSSGSPMPGPRNQLGAATAGGLLYAVGGLAGGKAVVTVERYTP